MDSLLILDLSAMYASVVDIFKNALSCIRADFNKRHELSPHPSC